MGHHALMRGYSADLRKKIVDAVRRRRPKAEVARIFGVGISSVKRYTKMAEEEGSLDPKKAPGKKRKLDESGRSSSKRTCALALPPPTSRGLTSSMPSSA